MIGDRLKYSQNEGFVDSASIFCNLDFSCGDWSFVELRPGSGFGKSTVAIDDVSPLNLTTVYVILNLGGFCERFNLEWEMGKTAIFLLLINFVVCILCLIRY